MALNPANALDKKLKWGDFKKKDGDPPGEGEFAYAAETAVALGTTGGTNVDPVAKSDPTIYRLRSVPTVNVTFVKTNWVMKYALKWDKKHKDDLLDHEQIHYLISALAGRDCHNSLKAIKKKDYDDTDTAVAEIEDAFALLDIQDIQTKYDEDTHSLPTDYPVKQKAWATAVRACKTNGKPLRTSLETAGLITKQP